MVWPHSSSSPLPRRRGVCGVMLMALCLAGCGAGDKAPDTQVAARVNKDDISVHQVQVVLKRQPRMLAEQQETAVRMVLENLVEQELAAQAAREHGLDRDPAVVQALQVARREVLARAYQDQLASKARGPSADEIDRYYESKPALFAQRRLYTLQEFALEASALQLQRLQEIVKQAKSADELAELLRNSGLRFRSRQLAQAAEDLPMVLLEPLAKMGVGQSLLLPQGTGARIFTILHAQTATVDRRLAADVITAFLVAEHKRQLVAQGMKTLRDGAKIEYHGAFARPAQGGAAAEPAEAASDVR